MSDEDFEIEELYDTDTDTDSDSEPDQIKQNIIENIQKVFQQKLSILYRQKFKLKVKKIEKKKLIVSLYDIYYNMDAFLQILNDHSNSDMIIIETIISDNRQHLHAIIQLYSETMQELNKIKEQIKLIDNLIQFYERIKQSNIWQKYLCSIIKCDLCQKEVHELGVQLDCMHHYHYNCFFFNLDNRSECKICQKKFDL